MWKATSAMTSRIPATWRQFSGVAPIGSGNCPATCLHNIVSHGMAKLAEFLDDELSEIVASAHQSPQLRKLGGQEILDELRVLIRDRNWHDSILLFFDSVENLD
jgi:hypothetical protein